MAMLSFRITFPPNMTAGEEGERGGKRRERDVTWNEATWLVTDYF